MWEWITEHKSAKKYKREKSWKSQSSHSKLYYKVAISSKKECDSSSL